VFSACWKNPGENGDCLLEMIGRFVSAGDLPHHKRHCLNEEVDLMSVPIKSLGKTPVK
jgi:hypothetical protein